MQVSCELFHLIYVSSHHFECASFMVPNALRKQGKNSLFPTWFGNGRYTSRVFILSGQEGAKSHCRVSHFYSMGSSFHLCGQFSHGLPIPLL